MTSTLHFRVIDEKDLLGSMRVSFLEWSMEMSFFGMHLYILDVCPENRDESNGDNKIKLWLQFIPIFGALHSQLRKGHTKKDISIPFCIEFLRSSLNMYHSPGPLAKLPYHFSKRANSFMACLLKISKYSNILFTYRTGSDPRQYPDSDDSM
jgi:hypothetical protein